MTSDVNRRKLVIICKQQSGLFSCGSTSWQVKSSSITLTLSKSERVQEMAPVIVLRTRTRTRKPET